MADEQKPTTNVAAENDVQNVLAELKGADGAEKPQDDPEEARIVAEAAKLGEKSEQTQEKSQDSRDDKQRGRRTNFRNAAKFDPSSQAETDDPVEIRKQVEFYLSDSNLPMDKFLLSKVGGSANNAVPLELLHSFKRMRRFQPFSAIVEALKTAETVELVDNDTAVKRKVPLPESVAAEASADIVKVFQDKAMPRSIYVKGFGPEQATTQFDIEKLFEPYGPINSIRLRRGQDKGFKGSVFVEFANEEKQKEFLDLAEKPKWNGQDLIIKSKKQYCEEKVEEINSGRMEPNPRRSGGGRGGRGRGSRIGRRDTRRDAARKDRDGRDERDWRDRRDEDQKQGFKNGEASGGEKRSLDGATDSDRPAKKVDVKDE